MSAELNELAEARVLSGAEQTFALRMAPHIERGLSAASAANAVMDDDARLVAAFFNRGASHYFPTPDDRGIARPTGERPGDVIVRELSRTVWTALRSKAASQ